MISPWLVTPTLYYNIFNIVYIGLCPYFVFQQLQIYYIHFGKFSFIYDISMARYTDFVLQYFLYSIGLYRPMSIFCISKPQSRRALPPCV